MSYLGIAQWLKQLMSKFRKKKERVELSAAVKPQGGLQAGTFGPTPDGGQKFGARRDGWSETKEGTELDTAQRFSRFTGSGVGDLEVCKTDDDADVRGKAADASIEEFQITRLWHGEFWQRLNAKGATRDGQFSKDEMRELILDAIARKSQKYTLSRRRALNLLIDTNPVPVLASLAEYTRQQSKDQLLAASFKSVWLVGAEAQHTYRLA